MNDNLSASLSRDDEISKEYLIAQGSSLLFDQIERIRGFKTNHISELMLIVAKKNPKQEKYLRLILNDGFTYNGVHYSRFGKSASQGKAGITAFVSDDIFDELYMTTQMDVEIDECVISKYEAQRCLPFSSCSIIHDYIPKIVIIGEYEKTLEKQLIKYVVEKKKEFIDKETGKTRYYTAREIEEGYKDIGLSPFDGCGCHELEFMIKVSDELGLDYSPIGCQIRLPFIKGYSVYVPFRDILREWGYECVTDIYGNKHNIDDIDCIWNTSMFKGHKIFKQKYGSNAWIEYMNTLKKYNYKLGISKYSHHVKHLNKYTRANFQYIQCLDLWNPKYIDYYENKNIGDYNILDSNNDGKVISLAKYTTSLYEKIIKGEKFYLYKFMGITDSDEYEPESRYLEAALVNDVMLKDPSVKQYIYRKLKKSIDDAKVGKIYLSGFYHTVVGDMIGYLQYAVGIKTVGCLNEHELYSDNFDTKTLCAFRSPLVDASEVNKIQNVHNEILSKWFSYFRDQDVVMFNMYDLSFPQMGGMDADGDIIFLCDDKIVIESKINKNIIIDIEDKATAMSKPYTKENIIEYEVMTRDSRIGEITNVGTSIENKYITNSEVKKLYDNFSSLLRIFQGKEIDFVKTGLRWQMSRGLRKHLKQLPFFLLYKYPQKMKTYSKLIDANKKIEIDSEKLKLNAYHSPSPMNELCDYICIWEKKKVVWDNNVENLIDSRCLIVNNDLDLTNRQTEKCCRKIVNEYADALRAHLKLKDNKNYDDSDFAFDEFVLSFKNKLSNMLNIDEELIANYVINVSYKSLSISKSFAWTAYGDYIIKNLNENSNPRKHISIVEVPYNTIGSYEYLGKYYEFKEANEYR